MVDLDNRPCQECGFTFRPWFAPDRLWNLVMGGPGAKDDPGGVVCPNCFIELAEAAGINPPAWCISDRQEPHNG